MAAVLGIKLLSHVTVAAGPSRLSSQMLAWYERIMASFRHTIEQDLLACKVISPHAKRAGVWLYKHVLYGLYLRPSFACVFWYRINRLMHVCRVPGKDLLSVWRHYRFANDISYYADIGAGFRPVHVIGIVIGGNAVIGERVTMLNDVTIGALRRGDMRMPCIGSDVYFGSGARVLGNITIGHEVQIGALAFINASLPDRAIAYGIPPNVTVKLGEV